MAFTLPIGQPAPDFDLPGMDGKRYSLADFSRTPGAGRRLLVQPLPVRDRQRGPDDRVRQRLRAEGVAMVAINSNETENHPDRLVRAHGRSGRRRRSSRSRTCATRARTWPGRTAHCGRRTTTCSTKDERTAVALRYTGRMDDNPRDAGQGDRRTSCATRWTRCSPGGSRRWR